MKIFTPVILFLTGFILFTLLSCNKQGEICITNTGTIIMQNRNISDFDSIRMLDYVNLILVPSNEKRVVVEAGENIINGIITNLNGGELILGNSNRCNWLRSYSKPLNVYVYTNNLLKIHYESSGNITCTDTLRSDSLLIDIWGGCGNIDLKLNINKGIFNLHKGTATVDLDGICNISSVYSADYGLMQLTGLKTGFTFITTLGTNDSYVNAKLQLNATIRSIGNIYFSGDPDLINATITGEGKLIPY